MTADALGNDITEVFVPVTGFMAYAPSGTAMIDPEDGGDPDFALPNTFKKVGLFTEDGGFEWTTEPDGDPIVFFQDGYQIPSGLANATVVAKLAESSPIVRALVWGKTPDANGYITIDAGGHADDYVFFTEEIGKNGKIRRRQSAGTVSGVKQDKSERGTPNGYEATCTMRRHPSLNNEHIGEWFINPS